MRSDLNQVVSCLDVVIAHRHTVGQEALKATGHSPIRSSVPPCGTSLRVVGNPQGVLAFVQAGDAGGSEAELRTTPHDGSGRIGASSVVGQPEWLKGASPASRGLEWKVKSLSRGCVG